MPVGWFLSPYKQRAGASRITRYCAVDDLSATIYGEGGKWSETEVLGQHAIVKVRASSTVLAQVAALPGVMRVPVSRLDDRLSSLSAAQKTAIRNKIQELGYSLTELQNRFPNDFGGRTLRELLKFIASRRRKVRYDAGTDTIVDDGPEQPVRPLEDVDAEVE